MTQAVTTAVFPVAGLCTRFLPVRKAMLKELLPIIDRPVIQGAVAGALAAGTTRFVFVTGRIKRAIADHFAAAPELEHALDKAANPTAACTGACAVSKRSQVLPQKLPLSETYRHGIAMRAADDESSAGLVDKPVPGDRCSALTSLGRCVFHPEVFDVRAARGTGRGSEIKPGDTIDVLARRGCVAALPLDAERHDCGTYLVDLGATIAAASSLSRPDMGA
jgi:UTP-glucose-1-phosphate uridylyltransferase